MVAIYRQGESSGGGRKPKTGARKTVNGKEMMWNGSKWVSAPNHSKKDTSAAQAEMDKRRYVRPRGATGGRGGSFYTVNGITYDRKTGRPIIVPKNRQPVKAKDRTPKPDTAPSSNPPRSSSNSSTPVRKPPTAPPPVPKGVVEKTADRYKAKAKTVKERKKYLQTKQGGGLSKRMAAALADKDALKFKG